MIGRIRNQWENVAGSLWFVPGWCILFVAGLAFVMPEMDERFDARSIFPGDASSARTVLQVVAGSLITVISLVFSITILVLQQASRQYTPRLIGNFMGFRGVQIVLGIFLGTFLYALLILRHVRESEDRSLEYVPVLSVTGAITLALLCIALLVYFIHHTAVSLEVPAITRRIAQQLLESLEIRYPSIGQAVAGDDSLEAFHARHRDSVPVEVRAVDSGFVRRIDEERILDALPAARWVAVRVRVDSYVHYGDLLVEVDGVEVLEDDAVASLRKAFVLGIERSLHQDPLFGIRQLVDIALRALSPSLNDPTTVEYVLSQLGDLLIVMGRQHYTSRIREIRRRDGSTLDLWADRAMFDDFVDISFSQIRRMAREMPHVTMHLLDVIEAVGRNVSEHHQLEPLHRQISEIRGALDESDLRPTDRDVLYAKTNDVLVGMRSAYDRVAARTPEARRDR